MTFDLDSREGLFDILLKIGCPQKLHSLIISFQDEMKATIRYEGSESGIKHESLLALTLFDIFSDMLYKHPFGTSTEGVYLRTRHDASGSTESKKERCIDNQYFLLTMLLSTRTPRKNSSVSWIRSHTFLPSAYKTDQCAEKGCGHSTSPKSLTSSLTWDPQSGATSSLTRRSTREFGKAGKTLGSFINGVGEEQKLSTSTKMAVFTTAAKHGR